MKKLFLYTLLSVSVLGADNKTNIVTGVTPGWVTNQIAIATTNILTSLTNGLSGVTNSISGLSTNLLLNNILLYQHQAAAGTDGGAFNTGAWRTIPINTEVLDFGQHGVITNTNDIFLQGGSYRYNYWILAAGDPQYVRGRITNVTDGAVITSSYSQSTRFATTGGGFSYGIGRFTISTNKQLRLQGQVGANCLFGSALNLDGAAEVFSSIEFIRE